MYTDGRTGSTAICDEIGNHSDLACWQELFTYGANLAFLDGADLSKMPSIEQGLADGVLTYEMFRRLCDESTRGHASLSRYFDYLGSKAGSLGKEAFGFKLLYNHATHWEGDGLLDTLAQRGFAVLHNLRLDFVRKYISGAIASKTGRWNTRSQVVHREMVVLDPDLCRENSAVSLTRYRKYDADIRAKGFSVLTETYEDFLDERVNFLNVIFDFLGVELERVADSDWQKVTPQDLSTLVENYQDFESLIKSPMTVQDIVSK